MGYNLLINGVYWGYNPLTNHLPAFTSDTTLDLQTLVQSGCTHAARAHDGPHKGSVQ